MNRRGEREMRRLLCWLFDHDYMNTSARHRICVRCEKRETLHVYGEVLAWEAATRAVTRG